MSHIFTLTAVRDCHLLRVWGWYHTFEEAEQHVLLEGGDDSILESGTFPYILIEKVPAGAPTRCEQQWWYHVKCRLHDYSVTPCEAPAWAKNVLNISMG